MPRRSLLLILVTIEAATLAGCAQNAPRPESAQRQRGPVARAAAVPGLSPIAVSTTATSPQSPLAKIRQGMTFEEVVAVLGPPTAQRSQLTAQAFNPFAVGNQGQVTRFYYEKLGRVVFAGPDYSGNGTAVIAVESDPHESGQPRE